MDSGNGGVDRMAIKHAISRKMYWWMSRTPDLRYAMTNKWLKQEGWLTRWFVESQTAILGLVLSTRGGIRQ